MWSISHLGYIFRNNYKQGDRMLAICSKKAWASKAGGRGMRPPRSKNQRGDVPPEIMCMSVFFIETYATFAFSNIFKESGRNTRRN